MCNYKQLNDTLVTEMREKKDVWFFDQYAKCFLIQYSDEFKALCKNIGCNEIMLDLVDTGVTYIGTAIHLRVREFITYLDNNFPRMLKEGGTSVDINKMLEITDELEKWMSLYDLWWKEICSMRLQIVKT